MKEFIDNIMKVYRSCTLNGLQMEQYMMLLDIYQRVNIKQGFIESFIEVIEIVKDIMSKTT